MEECQRSLVLFSKLTDQAVLIMMMRRRRRRWLTVIVISVTVGRVSMAVMVTVPIVSTMSAMLAVTATGILGLLSGVLAMVMPHHSVQPRVTEQCCDRVCDKCG